MVRFRFRVCQSSCDAKQNCNWEHWSELLP